MADESNYIVKVSNAIRVERGTNCIVVVVCGKRRDIGKYIKNSENNFSASLKLLLLDGVSNLYSLFR